MKCQIDIEVEDLAKELVQHLSLSELASEVADHIELDELAGCIEASHIAEHIEIDPSDIEVDYFKLHDEISYKDLADEIDSKEVAEHVNQFDIAAAMQEQDSFKEVVNNAVAGFLTYKLDTLAESIAAKIQTIEKKDNDKLKQPIIEALAAL